METNEKSQFRDCPACGAGGIVPDENGKCTRCGANIESSTGSTRHTERVSSEDSNVPVGSKYDSDDSDAIKELVHLYGISADSNLLTHLVSGLESARLSLKLTKRRSFAVYLYGFLGPLLMIGLLISVVISNNVQVPPILIIPIILVVLLGIGIFFGARLARDAFYFIPLLNMFCGFLAGGAGGAGSALGSSILGWILYVVLMRQPHTQAFFANDRYPLPILTVEKLLLRGSSISRSMLAKHDDLKATLGELRDSVDTYVSEGGKPSRRVKQLSARLQRLLK